jgi:hypothetical protein
VVQAREVERVERRRKSIPNSLHGCEITPDACRISGARVDLKLTRPELETGAVDLGRGLVAKLEVERGLGHADRGGRSASLIAGFDRPRE